MSEQHNDRQVRYFSRPSLPRMDPDTRSATPYTQRQVQAVVDATGLTPSDAVLDVGCGPGKYTVALARRGLDVSGMDLTPALIEALHAFDPSIPAVVGDLVTPPAEWLGRFDVVVGFFVLHHIEDLAGALRGVRALLRPGGRVAFLEPNPAFVGYYLQILLTPGMSWAGDRGIVRMRRRVLAEAATAAGFAPPSIERFGAFPPVLANRRWGARAETTLEAVPGWRRLRAFQLLSFRPA